MKLTVVNTPQKYLQYTNLAYINKEDASELNDSNYVTRGQLVVKVDSSQNVPKGTIALNKYQRIQANVNPGEAVDFLPFDISNLSEDQTISLEVKFLAENSVEKKNVNVEQFIELFKKCFSDHVFVRGQSVALISNAENVSAKTIYTSSNMVLLKPSTKVFIITAKDSVMKLTNLPYNLSAVPKFTQTQMDQVGNLNENVDNSEPPVHDIFNSDFTFEQLGIGGLDKELNIIFRRAFASRAYPPEIAELMDAKHCKGIILHGPAGTGKTLVAKQLGTILNCKKPTVVNGPSIFGSHVGESEENIRKLFEPAYKDWEEHGPNSELHLIIMDEIDAICKERGRLSDNTGVRDSVVNQLLTMMDGVNTPSNFLVIGMTNRLDMIDPAMLRPGRFEVQLEIGLPNDEGRRQILRIHTAVMEKNHFLSNDVDMDVLVEKTKNFTGAEIMGLVSNARSYALNRGIDMKNHKVVASSKLSEQIKVTMADFLAALREGKKPAFGISVTELNAYLGKGIIRYGGICEKILNKCHMLINSLSGENTNLSSVLLEGDKGCGKTAIAAHMAMFSKFPCVKIVSANDMVGMSEIGMSQYVSNAFFDAYKSEKSVVVLDSVERLIQLVRVGPRFSNIMLQTLLVLIKKQPPEGRKLLIVATTSVNEYLESLDLTEQFDRVLNIPPVSGADNIKEVLINAGTITDDHLIQELVQAIGKEKPIKKLLQLIDIVVANEGKNVEEIMDLFDFNK